MNLPTIPTPEEMKKKGVGLIILGMMIVIGYMLFYGFKRKWESRDGTNVSRVSVESTDQITSVAPRVKKTLLVRKNEWSQPYRSDDFISVDDMPLIKAEVTFGDGAVVPYSFESRKIYVPPGTMVRFKSEDRDFSMTIIQ